MEIRDNSLIFADNGRKMDILRHLSDASLFLDLIFINPLQPLGKVSNQYHFYLKNHYDIDYALSKKILPYFDYLDTNKVYKSSRLEKLQSILKQLIDNNIFIPFDYASVKERNFLTVDSMPVTRHFLRKATEIKLGHSDNGHVKLVESPNAFESSQAVYQETITLLDKGISPRNIVIVNAATDDTHQLRKLFHDAHVPVEIDCNISLFKYPVTMKLLEILTVDGFVTFKQELLKQSEGLVKTKIINILNQFRETDLMRNPNILSEMIKSAWISPKLTSNSVRITDFLSITYDENIYYLLMNYTDSELIKYQKSFEYLTESEADEIGYPSIDSLNYHLERKIENILSSLKNLVLFFPIVKDKENRIPVLNLNRKVILEKHRYLVTKTSHLPGLDFLEYAKARHAYDNYALSRPDLGLLANTFGSKIDKVTHDFTGIDTATLKLLLSKHNTLTGAKIESFNLCGFQFLLKYLMKFSEVEKTTSQFLGSLTHEVFDESLRNPNLDVSDIVAFHLEFPEAEIHKEAVYRKALLGELERILPIFHEFHEDSRFEVAATELAFRIPYDEFFITGTIDKVMTYKVTEDNHYFVIIDYKINDKDFESDKFDRGLMLQMPIYMYAYMKMNDSTMKPAGLFYQKTGIGRYKRDESVESGFRLRGIALENEVILRQFDGDLEHILGINFKKDGGFANNRRKRTLSDSEFSEMFEKVRKQIDNAVKKIKSGDFSINPLPSHGIKKDSVSCQYCDFSHICFNKNRGLGGDEE